MTNAPKTRKPKPTVPQPVISIEIPPYLDVAPTGVSSLLAITLKQTLPISQLQWRDFEKLCVRLIRRQGGIVQCRLYGTEGQRQKGIDIFSRTDAGEVHLWTIFADAIDSPAIEFHHTFVAATDVEDVSEATVLLF